MSLAEARRYPSLDERLQYAGNYKWPTTNFVLGAVYLIVTSCKT